MGPAPRRDSPQLVQGTALKRGGQPGEVAELAAFLCSERATYTTGAVIPVDGGMAATLARPPAGRRKRPPVLTGRP